MISAEKLLQGSKISIRINTKYEAGLPNQTRFVFSLAYMRLISPLPVFELVMFLADPV